MLGIPVYDNAVGNTNSGVVVFCKKKVEEIGKEVAYKIFWYFRLMHVLSW